MTETSIKLVTPELPEEAVKLVVDLGVDGQPHGGVIVVVIRLSELLLEPQVELLCQKFVLILSDAFQWGVEFSWPIKMGIQSTLHRLQHLVAEFFEYGSFICNFILFPIYPILCFSFTFPFNFVNVILTVFS